LLAVVCLMVGALAPTASAKTVFHPRVGGALGLMPPVNSQGVFGSQDIASGALIPVTYHGGSVMTGGVTVHTVFWAPAGSAFQRSPGASIPTYKGLVQQFFTDAAAASGTASSCSSPTAECNMFTVLPQFAQGTSVGHITPGDYSIRYSTASDSVNDTDPYPAAADQCASPNNATGACITDAQVQAEVDHLVQGTLGHPRGLHDLWYVFLPPNVDECILPGVCGTNAFGGYHSVSDVGHGVTIYAVTIDPIIEAGSIAPGGDPQGNPDAELTADIAGHETVEAMTDPEGVGYVDPNGFEVADKCEFGPQRGTPLGFANGSPYNQVINGNKYLLQEMWSNDDNGCVQGTNQTSNPLPLPQVNLTQFSSTATGNIGANTAGVTVTVSLLRSSDANGTPVTVAQGSGTTDAAGNWSASVAPHVFGDDRDEIDVDYSGPGAPTPNHQVILTGNGGNPFTESGWTGWTALDNGAVLTNDPSLGGPLLGLAPCFQTGVLTATVNGSPIPSSGTATDFCNTQTGIATVSLGAPVAPSDIVTQSTNDNRAFQDPNLPSANPIGGLVRLTVPVGEPDAVSSFVSPLATFTPTGFPTCTADLEAQSVSCSGLVAGRAYTLTDARSATSKAATGNADGTIAVSFPNGALHGGDALALSNGARTVTTLHLAHLKVAIVGQQTVLAGGTCEPDNYYGPPLTKAPTNLGAGDPTIVAGGAALTGEACPASGDAAGLSASSITQTDEQSGGQTETEVPDVENTSPLQGETVYGSFTALAESGLPGPNNTVIPTDGTSRIALSIAPARGGSPVFTADNVDTPSGVSVGALAPGAYQARWTLSDANGDTRTVTTRFIEQPATQGPAGPRGPQGPPGAQGPRGPRGATGPKPSVSCELVRHHKITCRVTYPNAKQTTGKLQVRIARGKHVVALGHAHVSRGVAYVTLREARRISRGMWTMTLVLTQPHQTPSTAIAKVRVT
jgi:hypothetical protein